MKITTYIWKLACLTGLALVSACNDTELVKRNVVEEGIPVKVSLNFSSTMPEEVSVGTRADAEDPEYRINDLYVLVFNPDGTLRENGWHEYTSLAEQTTTTVNGTETLQGTVPQMTLLTGDVVIYGIANAISRPSEYIPGDEEQDLATQIEAVKSISDLEAIRAQLATRDANALGRIAGTRYIMSGRLEGTVQTDGTVRATDGGTNNTIPLYRTDSHIRFDVSAAQGSNCTSFTLLSYTVHRVPAATSLVSLSSGKNYDAGQESADGYWDVTSAIQVEGNAMDFYVPENLKDAKTVDGDACDSYRERELCTKNADGTNGTFRFAPDNGTYVVLHGIYEGKATTKEYADFVTGGTAAPDGDGKLVDVRGIVDYTIHLGTWTDTQFDDFSNRRNVEYTYTVRVAGVDDIIVEVETRGDAPTENEPGAEGDIFFQQGTLIDVDAHNSAVVLEFTAADIKAAVDAQTNQGQDYFQYQVNSPFGEADSLWLHFRLNDKSSDTYSRMVRTYPGDGDNELLTLGQLMDVLQDIGNNMSPDSTSSTSRYADSEGDLVVTCFVNEYYYDDAERTRLGLANWGDFTNTSNREAYIFGAINHSQDGNSSTILTKYVITQRSIQTMDAYYIVGGAEGMGYGLETFNETGQIAMGDPGTKPTGSERGRANTVAMLDGLLNTNVQPWGYVPDTQTARNYLTAGADAGGSIEGYNYIYPDADMYKYASYACLMRNRDEDGNGRIDEDEIKWFLPSLDQYAEVFAGLDALSMDSRLYTDTEWKLKHYLTSTWAPDSKDKNNYYPWIVWSEEGFCTQILPSGRDYANDPEKSDNRLEKKEREYRCMRYLNDEYDPENQRQPFYNYDKYTRVISFNHLRDGVFRSRIVNDELEEHNGRENANRLYHAFQVAEDYIKDGKSNKTFTPLDARKIPSPCANYSEQRDGSDKGTWRIPNQRELMMMLTAGVFDDLKEGNFVHCQTLFSHNKEANPLPTSDDTKGKYGYAVQKNSSGTILMLLKTKTVGGNDFINGENGFIRCVKDVYVPIE